MKVKEWNLNSLDKKLQHSKMKLVAEVVVLQVVVKILQPLTNDQTMAIQAVVVRRMMILLIHYLYR
jgi:hypothetical protein